MRITYIQDQETYRYKGDYYHPKSIHYFTKYLSGLSDVDYLVVVGGIIETEDEVLISKCKLINHEKIQFKGIPNFRKLSNFIEIKKRVDDEVKQADFCYLRCGIASSFAALCCMKYNVPYMSILNEDVFRNSLTHPKLMVKASAFPLWILTRFAVKKADYACYVTQNYLQSKYPNQKCAIGCSDVEALDLDEKILSNRLESIETKSDDIYVVGTAGSVEAYLKAHDLVIKALKILKDDYSYTNIVYEIVGTGNPKRLRDLAEQLGVLNQVRFLGQLSHDDVLLWMDNLDVYVHPSRSEGLPRTIIEAISRATPCIASDVGGIPELISAEYIFESKRKKPEKDIADLIIKMTKAERFRQADINFNHAKDFDPLLIKQKRDEFFRKAIEAVRRRNK